MADFKTRLKELRIERRLTQKELGKSLKLSESAIGMYERGERQPSIELTKEIASFFGVSRSYLLGDTNDRTNESSNNVNKDIEELIKDPDFMVAYHEYPGSPEEAKEDLIGFLKMITEREKRMKKKK